MARFSLIDAQPLAVTGLARLWRVRLSTGGSAVLKLYARPDRGNEGPGTRLLHAWRERGAVQILDEDQEAVLMEDLQGPTLGDVARRGEIKTALQIFAALARDLHSPPVPAFPGLQPLEAVFAPLFGAEFDDTCPPAARQNVGRARDLACDLLKSQNQVQPLHGDLHFDNVLLTETGARVIDAKGYLGDPAFELANALRHPRGLPELVRNPVHIRGCIARYARAMSCTPDRLLRWSAAKCALSIAWRAKGRIAKDEEADLLALLLDLTDQ
jgi:streptomycin 6-kinase